MKTLAELEAFVNKTNIFPVDMVLDLPTIFKELLAPEDLEDAFIKACYKFNHDDAGCAACHGLWPALEGNNNPFSDARVKNASC